MLNEIVDTFDKNYKRLIQLIDVYESLGGRKKGRSSVKQTDLLRATVVFTHSTLEEFLRGVQLWKLPFTDKENLKLIPLSGTDKREKFYLSDLANFKGSTVKEVIRISIREHLNNTTYNNTTQLSNALNSCNISINDRIKELLPDINSLMQRRHKIVHEADKNRDKGKGHHSQSSISLNKVENWITTIDDFATEIISNIE